ncbi:hypothetical protein ACOUV0_15920 [Acinetobacter baumannii]|uniref:hypothetical protein n=1 Tax=Acinetobacter calcoaceticus/baumannii complex TaxID=909768 RepID=UPI001D18445F|nr:MULTISPECIES: hypothetical protein [Acinetobacter calcoaceticus/baumannii complex]MDE4038326.1 hypothetical protein [Acinetobacter pittii]MDV7377638.1 hypothetical protein [Acinetobacter baumannii]WPP76696.1 hypothetical protein SOI71_15425 [Acinetobacter pittii]WPP88990.1 hypothetical protein SOI77_02885 [Acinetobacter pittii]
MLIGIDLKASKNVDILKSEKNIIGKNYSAGLNREILNKVGDFYPNVPDLRTGRTVSFPVGDLKKVPESSRVTWGCKKEGSLFRSGISEAMKPLVAVGLSMIFIILNLESLVEQMNSGI